MPTIPGSDSMADGANHIAFGHFQHHGLKGFSTAVRTDCE